MPFNLDQTELIKKAMSKQEEEEGKESYKDVPMSKDLQSKFERFVLGTYELTKEDQEELAEITELPNGLFDCGIEARFKHIKNFDFSPFRNLRKVGNYLCWKCYALEKQDFSAFSKVTHFGVGVFGHCPKFVLDCKYFSSVRSIKEGFCYEKGDKIEVLNAHCLKEALPGIENANNEWLRIQIHVAVKHKNVEELMKVYMISMLGKCKLSQTLSAEYAPRILTLKFLLC